MNNHDLLELYVREKADLDDPLYGPPFPTFKEWKHEVQCDRASFIVVTTVKNALSEADEITASDFLNIKCKETDMSKVQKRGRKPASKVDKARKIFDRMYPNKSRAEVLKQFQSKTVGLTPAGASTYYQKFKSELAA